MKKLLDYLIYLMQFHYRRGLASCGKKVRFGKNNVLINRGHIRIGSNVICRNNVTLQGGRNDYCSIGNRTIIDHNVLIRTTDYSVEIGDDCSINFNTIVLGKIKIGNQVRIGPLCCLVGGNHVFSDLSDPIYKQGMSYKGIVIEDNVWIGAHASILDGVTIGCGSVIGAGTVVTKSIPPYSVAVGCPARVIRSRKEALNEKRNSE